MSLFGVFSASKFVSHIRNTGATFQQVRNKWGDWRTIKDVKRRRMNAEVFTERLRVNALRKTNILPIEIIEKNNIKIRAYPKNCTTGHINNRCVVTSRPRGLVFPWRLSRFVWRHLVDYNKMSGVQRAMWGFS